MSEYEQPGRFEREPTVEDVRQLMGASTPHFAIHLRNRIRTLVSGLSADHPARLLGDREIARLDQVALGSERRGEEGRGEPGMPSLRASDVPESGSHTGAA